MKDSNGLKLKTGDNVNITLQNGDVRKNWYVYDAKCGYLSKIKGSQTGGFMYCESCLKIEKA